MNTQELFNLSQEVKIAEYHRRKLFLILGERFYQIKKDKLYKKILGETASWSEFLAQPEIMLSRNEVYNLVRVHKKYVIEHGLQIDELSQIPLSRLLEMIPVIKSKFDIEDWFFRAKTLSPSDFTKELRIMKGLPIEDECEHKFINYKICNHCGEKQKNEIS